MQPTRPGPVISARRAAAHHAGLDVHLHVFIATVESLYKKPPGSMSIFTRLQRLLEYVAVPVQQEQAGIVLGDEPVHVHAAAAMQQVGQPPDPHK